MSDGDPPDRTRAKSGSDRDARLAAALRENLRRRKSQQRARREVVPPATPKGGQAGTKGQEPSDDETV